MTHEEFMQEITENDKKVAVEHLTEEQEEKEFADFIKTNHCKTKKVKNG